MVLAIDFDGTIVSDARPYDDVTTPLRLLPGARRALLSLKRAGHVLVLWSARSSPALLEDPGLDPLVRAGLRDPRGLLRKVELHRARHEQMIRFVNEQLPGVFDVVDDGVAGKLTDIDLFVDDRAVRLGRGIGGFGWDEIASMYGQPVYSSKESA